MSQPRVPLQLKYSLNLSLNSENERTLVGVKFKQW